MPETNQKRVELRLTQPLYDRLLASAITEGRSVNRQVAWLLDYALIDWRENWDNRLERLAERAAG